ncbi:unnamed protein product [Cylindrotheca closterium]|uniref:Gfo/Idh/MocA-like oxidoreductase N-terminal domain-containing protein n=1 Tax=Cylindrotheca closterium TaxID=2856 RepID=A0AAD2PW47_9STRA|nr:unnamed protein product [Cylindrotheca closterium]
MTGKLRIGLLGAAGISSKTAIAIASQESECVVTAISSRSEEKAKKFVKDCPGLDSSTTKIFGGANAYNELIQSSDYDALYIPLPVAVKKAWILQALQNGKHVVLEKPAALTANDYQEMLKVAYANGKFLLDGTMFPHHSRMSNILERVAAGNDVGSVDRIQCSFTFLADEAFLNGNNIRARKEDGDPHGCIGDVGWYCIRFGLMVYERLGINVISAKVVDCEVNQHGVPIDATCVVRFEGGKVLWFHCGFKTPLRQQFEICGSKKSILLDDLVLPRESPSSFELKSTKLTAHDLVTVDEKETVDCPNSPPHEVLLWKTFQSIARRLDASTQTGASEWKGDTAAEANKWGAMSLLNQKVIDALMKSIAEDGSEVKIIG